MREWYSERAGKEFTGMVLKIYFDTKSRYIVLNTVIESKLYYLIVGKEKDMPAIGLHEVRKKLGSFKEKILKPMIAIELIPYQIL